MTLQMVRTNALDLGLCSLPVEDPAFETTSLFDDELVAILPAKLNGVPKKVTPAFLSRCPLILGDEDSALRRTVTDWLALTGGPPPKPVMEFDHVEAIKSIVAVGLGASLVPRLSLGTGHVSAANMLVRPLNPPVSRPIRLVRLRGRRSTEGVELVFAALLALRRQREDALRRSTSNRADRSGRCPSPDACEDIADPLFLDPLASMHHRAADERGRTRGASCRTWGFSTLSGTHSAAISANRSSRPSAQRYSIAMV